MPIPARRLAFAGAMLLAPLAAACTSSTESETPRSPATDRSPASTVDPRLGSADRPTGVDSPQGRANTVPPGASSQGSGEQEGQGTGEAP